MDIISAGESHVMVGNSNTGLMYYWGKLRSHEKKLKQEETPQLINNYYFTRKGITDIKSGGNHILVLSGSRVYPFGDLTCGALGNTFKREKDRCNFDDPTSINLRNIKQIFTGDFTSFVLTHNGKKGDKKGNCFAFGLNNF
jgi:alpha-tubulin suppressor-like RCC1 family protein